jgi:hypothetical protein
MHTCGARKIVGSLALGLALLSAGCGMSEDRAAVDTGSAEAEHCAMSWPLVPADQVKVVGDLMPEDEAIVVWALGRFALLDVDMTTPISVEFDSSSELCNGEPGRCWLHNDLGAELYICEAAGDTAARIADRRLTVLHELAHVWHWSQGEGVDWPDLSSIVGGEPMGPDVAWSDRSVERVADVISWGLMDDERRRARGVIPCADMYLQFVALTGTEPLGPINNACVPEL